MIHQAELANPKTILSFGCGSGEFDLMMAKKFKNVSITGLTLF